MFLRDRALLQWGKDWVNSVNFSLALFVVSILSSELEKLELMQREGREGKGGKQKQSFRLVICLIHKAVKTTGEERRGKMENRESERGLISN